MKRNLILVAASLVSIAAHADLGRKAPLKADFHNLIVNAQQERQELVKEISGSISSQASAKPSADSDSRRVTDFVDVEIGWGEVPKTVDRRFDSVGEPVFATTMQ